MRFDSKKSKPAASGKKKLLRDARNYYVTQPSADLAAREKHKLASGIDIGGQLVSFKDGVLRVKKS